MKTFTLLLILILSFTAEAKLSVSDARALRGDLNRNGQVMQISIHYAKNKHDLDRKVLELKNYQLEEGQSGIAFYSKTDNVCQVFVIQPKRDTALEMATLGHEIYHCTNGKFH